MPIIHPSRATNPRDLQVASSRASHEEALSLATALRAAGVPCAIHQFPEFQGNWWTVCVDRKRDLSRAASLAKAFDAGVCSVTKRWPL